MSDHKSNTFNIADFNSVPRCVSAGQYARSFNSSTSGKFIDTISPLTRVIEYNCLGANPDELVNKFNVACSNTLDAVAPLN